LRKLPRRFRRDQFVLYSLATGCGFDHRSAATTQSEHDSALRSTDPPGAHRELRDALPGVALVQVVHVTGPEAVDEAIAVAPHVDAVLLDSGNQSLTIKELGGTGRTHDWTLSRKIREAIDVPLFLAGGLNPQNVAASDSRSSAVWN
jgi:phosphoribosylanthranilate isomerase